MRTGPRSSEPFVDGADDRGDRDRGAGAAVDLDVDEVAHRHRRFHLVGAAGTHVPSVRSPTEADVATKEGVFIDRGRAKASNNDY